MGDDAPVRKKYIVVTGFGPFGIHTTNVSWEAVQELTKLGLEDGVELITEELAVTYDYVTKRVPELWKTYSPLLMIHVGVSGIATKITMEQQAHNKEYVKPDVVDCLPENGTCVQNGADCVQSCIQMEQVCKDINEAQCRAEAEVSMDPGRFVCDFTFYKSLNVDRTRAAFIHVPCLDKPYSAKEMAEAIKVAIKSMLKQLPTA